MLDGKIVRIIFAAPVFCQDGKTVIGKDGDIPWRGLIPSDMARFRNLTRENGANTVIPGRKTYQSIPEQFRPFDNNLPPERARQTIVLTRDRNFKVENQRVLIAHTLEEAASMAKTQTVWIIGGAEIYALALPVADFLHITMIYERFAGDVFFPDYPRDQWRNIFFEHFEAGGVGAEKDKVNTSYLVFERRR